MCGNTTAQDKRGQEIPLNKKGQKTNKQPCPHSVYSPQFLSVRRGWFVGSGSGVVTSSPAAAICPLDKASYRSSWFTTAPLKPIIHHIFVFMYFNSKHSWCWKCFPHNAQLGLCCFESLTCLSWRRLLCFSSFWRRPCHTAPGFQASGSRRQLWSRSQTPVCPGGLFNREERRRNKRGTRGKQIIKYANLQTKTPYLY